MLSMRPTGDNPQAAKYGQAVYAPSRDIVWLYPNVVQTVERQLLAGSHKPLANWLKVSGVGEEEIAETIRCFCLFLNAAHQNPDKSMQECLKDSGYLDCPPAAQAAVQYYIGTNMAATFFVGIRDVVMLGNDTIPEVRRLMALGERMEKLLSPSLLQRILRWPRRLIRRRGKSLKTSVNGIPA